MLSKLEIYKYACDGAGERVDRLKHRSAVRYGKPDYDEVVKKMRKAQDDYLWLCDIYVELCKGNEVVK